MAKEVSEKKVIAALAPFCVDQFLKSADPAQVLPRDQPGLVQLECKVGLGICLGLRGLSGIMGARFLAG